jgi:polysaccharide biosynthesis/export protein VpsN
MIMKNVSRQLKRWHIAGAGVLAMLLLLAAGCRSGSGHFTSIEGADGAAATAGSTDPAVPVSTGNPVPRPESTNASVLDIFRAGEAVEVVFLDMVTPVPSIQDRIREDGTITLLENKTFHVADKARAQIEKEIHDFYVPNYYRRMTVIFRPQEDKRFYYVDGEVKSPNRFVYLSQMTVLKAIASAQGFTEWADRKNIQLTRADGRKEDKIDWNAANKDPKKDLEVFPGDKVYVPRKFPFSP